MTSQVALDNTNCIEFLWCMKNSVPYCPKGNYIFYSSILFICALYKEQDK